MGDTGSGQDGGELAGAVAGAVVGQDPFDGDAAGGEPRVRPGPEAGGGGLGLVGQDLGVGQPGVVVYGVVQVAVADPAAAFISPDGSASQETFRHLYAGPTRHRPNNTRRRPTSLWTGVPLRVLTRSQRRRAVLLALG